MAQPEAKAIILKLLKEKSALKQDVFHQTIALFKELKSVVQELASELQPEARAIDKRLVVDFQDKSEYEFELRVAGDVLIFNMHTNVFEFDKSHPLWRTAYVRDTPHNSFCGQISIYNFLNDSFKFNRVNDTGYLLARLFINAEKHYFVDGKRQLGFLYNDFVNNVIDRAAMRRIAESLIIYALDFDLYTPPFDAVKEVSVMQIMEASISNNVKTAKRLGFRFQADNDME